MSSKNPNLRRSRSLSQIPQPKSRSRSSSSSTNKDSGANFIRVPDRLLKRSNSVCSIKRSVATPVIRAGTKRPSSSTTPSSTRRSPFISSLQKKSRPIDDKKWVIEQFNKVRNYIQERNELDFEILKNLKPCTINSFVYICGYLFSKIDSRIEITVANYKETVLRHLKALCYPGVISLNLLKTVNTSYSWPQVISIFSWLIDLIKLIERVEDVEFQFENCNSNSKLTHTIVNYLRERYLMFNGNQEEEVESVNELFRQNLDLALNVDNEKIEQLQSEIAKLNETKLKHSKTINDQIKKITEYKEETEGKRKEIDEFTTNYSLIEKKNIININNIRDKKNILEKKLYVFKETNLNLKHAISQQFCSAKDKKILLQHIEDKKFTINLRKNKVENWKQLKDGFDMKVVEARRKIETEIHRLNSTLMPLTLISSDLKSLMLSDNIFVENNLQEEILNFVQKQNEKKTEINDKIKTIKTNIINKDYEILNHQNLVKKYNKIKEKLQSDEKEILQQIIEKKNEMELLIENYKLEKDFLADKLKQMENNEPDWDTLKLQIKALKEKKKTMQNNLELMKENCLYFFNNFAQRADSDVHKLNEILNNVIGLMHQSTEEAISQQDQVIQDLKKLIEDLDK